MASSASKTCSSGLMILVLVQIIALGVLVEGVRVIPKLRMTIENNMRTSGQKLDFHCHLHDKNYFDKDFGQLSVMPNNSFAWSFFGTDVFSCTFSTVGKPATTIDVFKGYGFITRPCCVRVTRYYWQALNDGFWCTLTSSRSGVDLQADECSI